MAFDTAKAERIEELEETLNDVGPTLGRQLLAESLRESPPKPPKLSTKRRPRRLSCPEVSLAVRALLHHAYGSRCAYCQRTGGLDLDYLVPPCRQGTTIETNLVVACERCRHSRRTLHLDAWIERRLELDKGAIYARIARATRILRRAHEPLRRAA